MVANNKRGMSLESMMAHTLLHTYDAQAVALIIVGADGTSVAVQMHCAVTDADEQEAIAQGLRQGCAHLSKKLRRRYVERMPDAPPLRIVPTDDGGKHGS